MRVNIDKSGRDDTTLCRDFSVPGANIRTNGSDAVAIDSHVGDSSKGPGTINHQPTANDDIVLHVCSCKPVVKFLRF
jgi:hypothetical protein